MAMAGEYAWSCCGATPTLIGGSPILNLLAPGCLKVYHQDKKLAWKLETLTMADPILFQE